MSQLADWWEKSGSWSKILIGLLGLILVVAGIMIFAGSNTGFLVKVDGREIGIIETQEIYDQALQQLKEEKTQLLGLKVEDIANQIEIVKVEDYDGDPLSLDDLTTLLDSRLEWLVQATAIKINGEDKVYVFSEKEGNEVLTKLKEEYVAKDEETEVLSVDFTEEVTLAETQANLSQVMDVEQALTFIMNGTDKVETYTVEAGDSLWTIAHKNGLTVNQLREANPQLKNDLLSIGQELKLVQSEPLLHVVTESKVTQEETIKYSTKYISDADMWRGQTSVKEPGKNGKKIVTYRIVAENGNELERQVLEEKILEEPKTRVVYQGTKVMTASRGGGGNGILAWPLRSKITSSYGWRGSGFHTGIDIDGVTGDPVFSAESGTVISAGWKGTYGYCIDIDHGDGLLTRYAHLSKIRVSMGQKVSRGDLIGNVGSTGRSTGSHLHFEVRINGNHKNPLNYLK